MSQELHGTVARVSSCVGKLAKMKKEHIMRVRKRYARQRHLWFSVWNTPDDNNAEAGQDPRNNFV